MQIDHEYGFVGNAIEKQSESTWKRWLSSVYGSLALKTCGASSFVLLPLHLLTIFFELQVEDVLSYKRNLERPVTGRLHHNCRVARHFDTAFIKNAGRPLQNQKLK